MRHFTLTLLALAFALTTEAQNYSETFTACALNVDGLPIKIYGYSLNPDGPGDDGSYAIGQYLAEKNYDLLAFSEDFNYHDTLMVSLDTIYDAGTLRGIIEVTTASQLYELAKSTLRFDTDGLEFLWRRDGFTATDESWTEWTDCHGYLSSGADSLITKGFRYYLVTFDSGFELDVFTLHMEAETSDEDNACRASQLSQLCDSVLSYGHTDRPKLIMGDTNCRYTRDRVKALLIDPLEASGYYEVSDAWVELCKSGKYPTYGTTSLMVDELGYTKGEVVDKVIYVNPVSGNQITATSITFDADGYVDSEGEALGDHVPVAVTFETTPTAIRGIQADNSDEGAEVMQIFNAGGQRLSTMQKGLNILRMTDGTSRKVLVK